MTNCKRLPIKVESANDPIVAGNKVDGGLGAVKPLAMFEDDIIGDFLPASRCLEEKLPTAADPAANHLQIAAATRSVDLNQVRQW